MEKLIALLSVTGALSAQAQHSTCVLVMDQQGDPVPFAAVTAQEQHLVADPQGKACFTWSGDSVHVSVTSSGSSTVQFLAGPVPATLSVVLSERVSDLPAFVASASMTGGSGPSRAMAGSAWYLGPKEVQRGGNTDVHRMLRSVPGVNIQEEDGFGLRPNIGLRGAGSERSSKVTLMEDGVLMAPAPYASPAAYFFPTTARMHAIEVVKGSSQLRHGPLTTGGAVNFISTPLPDRNGGRIALWGGSHGLRNLLASGGATMGGVSLLVETMQQNADGFKVLDNAGPTGFHKSDHLVKAGWNNGDKARWPIALQMKLGTTEEESQETYLGLTKEDFNATPLRRYAGSQRDLMNVEHDLLSAQLATTIPGGPALQATVYRTNTFRNWYKLDQVADSAGNKTSIGTVLSAPGSNAEELGILRGTTSGDNALLVKANNRNYQSTGAQLVIVQEWTGEKIKQRSELGARWHTDYMDRFQHTDGYRMENGTMMPTSTGPPGSESNRLASAEALAMHIVHDLVFGRFAVHPGLRFEHITMEDLNYGKTDPWRQGASLVETSNVTNVVLPGISADLRFAKAGMVFAGVHKGSSPAGPSAGAEAESSINYEAGLRWNRAGMEVQVIGFHNDYDRLLGADLAAAGGAGTGDQFNGGAATVAGAEVFVALDALRGRSEKWRLPIRVNYTWTDARFRSSFTSTFEPWGQVLDGDRIPFTPEHQMQVSAAITSGRFEFGLRMVHVGSTITATGTKAEDGSRMLDAWTVLDADACVRLPGWAEIFASVQNVLDDRYAVGDLPAGWRPGLPRTVQGGLRLRF
ncbi:MAG: TonB-dependent receptor [Flavobacteriales bacterium]|nr:MAG: TonB-dependent receptor [Flavobacteriales bacterium]